MLSCQLKESCQCRLLSIHVAGCILPLRLLLLLLLQVYLTLLCQWLVYWVLAVYLSNVLPNQVGVWVRKHALGFGCVSML
jgi:uncharacterized membrane protein